MEITIRLPRHIQIEQGIVDPFSSLVFNMEAVPEKGETLHFDFKPDGKTHLKLDVVVLCVTHNFTEKGLDVILETVWQK